MNHSLFVLWILLIIIGRIHNTAGNWSLRSSLRHTLSPDPYTLNPKAYLSTLNPKTVHRFCGHSGVPAVVTSVLSEYIKRMRKQGNLERICMCAYEVYPVNISLSIFIGVSFYEALIRTLINQYRAIYHHGLRVLQSHFASKARNAIGSGPFQAPLQGFSVSFG